MFQGRYLSGARFLVYMICLYTQIQHIKFSNLFVYDRCHPLLSNPACHVSVSCHNWSMLYMQYTCWLFDSGTLSAFVTLFGCGPFLALFGSGHHKLSDSFTQVLLGPGGCGKYLTTFQLLSHRVRLLLILWLYF